MPMTDVDRLAEVLRVQFGHVQASATWGWPEPARNVVDCVLSLNRRYDSFVTPRLDSFTRRRPRLYSLSELRSLIGQYESPLHFSIAELNYNHEARAQTLVGVVDYLLRVQPQYEGDDERQRLHQWAVTVKPADYLSVGVHGFGLAGFQYLRMLFDAQTTKPAVHIIRFVSEAIDRRVNDVQALTLLEEAARRADLPIRDVDHAIWQKGARGGQG